MCAVLVLAMDCLIATLSLRFFIALLAGYGMLSVHFHEPTPFNGHISYMHIVKTLLLRHAMDVGPVASEVSTVACKQCIMLGFLV